MEIREFGKANSRKIVLIPGNMMSWRQFAKVIPLLEKDFHVIVVSTDGYDGTGETTFTTSAESAEKLEKYIQDHLDGQVNLIFGESFGSATAGTLFHRQRVQADSLILSGPQYMNLGIINGFVTKVIPRNQYRLYNKLQDRKKLPWLLKLYTRSDDESLLHSFQQRLRISRFIRFRTVRKKGCSSTGISTPIFRIRMQKSRSGTEQRSRIRRKPF